MNDAHNYEKCRVAKKKSEVYLGRRQDTALAINIYHPSKNPILLFLSNFSEQYLRIIAIKLYSSGFIAIQVL